MTDDDLTLPGEASITTDRAESSDEDPTAKAAREADEKKLAIARKQFRTCVNALSHFRKEALDDTKFRAGTWGEVSHQWPAGVQEDREHDGRPCITVNRIPSFIRQVTNMARQAHLRIQVSPVDDKGDPKVAETIQSIIRNIEVQSWADRAYAAGSEKQAEIGLGIIGITVEWADPDNEKSMRRRIRIVQKKNPLAIYHDVAAREADWSDADYSFEVTDLDPDAYELHTGKKPPVVTDSMFGSDGDETGDWFPNGKIRIAQWFNREAVGEKKRIALLSDGTVIPYPTPEQKAEIEALGTTIKQDRYVQKRQLVWRKITGREILEESIWPARAQPYIPVMGDELEVDGEKDWRGVTRDAKGSARMYNVQASALIEAIGSALRAPVVGPLGAFGAPNSQQRKAWETDNRKRHAFLEYSPISIDNTLAPPPQRASYEPSIGNIVAGIQQTDNDLKTTAGFNDASLGERGPQESGKAIIARQRQDEMGSSHYLDNLRFALCSVGRQLVQLIRVYYDEPTVVRITGKDDRQRKVMVFSGAGKDPRNPEFLSTHPGPMPLPMADGSMVQPGQKIPFQLPEGVSDIYDLDAGEFDIEVSASPSSGSRRQEAVEAMSSLFERMPPELAAKFLDLYFMVMDFPLAQQMAERAKKLLPPELQDQDEGGPAAQSPQTVAQLQALTGQLQQTQQALQAAQQELGSQQQQLAAKERMFQLEQNIKGQLAQAEMQAKAAVDQADIQRQREKDQLEAAALERKNAAEIHAEIEKAKVTTEIKMHGELQLQAMKNESAKELAQIQARAQMAKPKRLTLEKDANGETIGARVDELPDEPDGMVA